MATPLVDATSSAQVPVGTTATTLTWSHTCTGSNLVLVVNVETSGGATTTSVTYNGVSMTAPQAKQMCPVLGWSTQQYYLANPTTGANNIVITASGTVTIMGFGISATRVNTANPIDSFTTSNGTSLSASTSLTTLNGNVLMVDSLALANSASTATQDAAQTLVATNLVDGTAGRTGGSSYLANTPTHAMTWTISGVTNRQWAQQIIALNPMSSEFLMLM